MSYDWGPHYIVPSKTLKTYSGTVWLREEFDEDLLRKELKDLGFAGSVVRVNNPWYYRKKNASTWIRIGESADRDAYFPVRWDTRGIDNGQYEVLGLMHVFVKGGDEDRVIARQNIVEVTVQN